MNQKTKMNLFLSICPILTVIILGLLSVTIWKAGMNIPIIGSIIIAGIIGRYTGISWKELQQSLVDGVARALPALFILIIVGSIIGSWISGGIIPVLIYYSLKIISPVIFIPACCIVTAIIATATGTSFTSIATVGLALMATGLGMGFPAPLLAGAIISGAYFGDSMSPLSDTTNLASAMTECSLFDLIKHLLFTGLPAILLSAIVFFFLGLGHLQNAVESTEAILQISASLENSFHLTPFLLLIPAITVFLSIKKVPAIPSLIIVSILGGLCAIFVQGETVGSVLNYMTSGFVSTTGVEMVDNLLTRGGINSMGNTVILLIIATSLGGILEKIGAMDMILNSVMKIVKTNGQLVLATVISGIIVAFATGAQLLAIVLPARMFAPEFKKRNLRPENLARIAQSVGCIGINLVPWSVPCTFAANILGVPPQEFIPYVLFAYLVILLNVIYGFTGITMTTTLTEK